jgi:predicted NUDIX family NTP pyrophosphohydrolase
MAKTSAGLLLFRRAGAGIEVLLVHPGGPLWAKKDDGAWSIPKGEVGGDENARMAAIRECREELGVTIAGEFLPLTPIRQLGGKVVIAWAVEADFDPATLRSNTFELEWPPRSGKRQAFPEVDKAAWFPSTVARQKILTGQVALIDQLLTVVTGGPYDGATP